MIWPQVQLGLNLLTVAVVVANVLLVRRYRRRRYSLGWVEGRVALLLAMAEAQSRGIPFREFVEAEAKRDYEDHGAVLGAMPRLVAEDPDA